MTSLGRPSLRAQELGIDVDMGFVPVLAQADANFQGRARELWRFLQGSVLVKVSSVLVKVSRR